MKSLSTAVLCTLLVSSVALAQKTTYDFDKTANFSGFKTYTMKDGTKVGDPLIDNRITAAIEAGLQAKGLTRSDSTPDLAVVYHVAFKEEKDISGFSSGTPYRWGGGWGTTNLRVNEILVGTLVIDMADAKKNEMVWRGVGVKEVNPNAKPDQRDKNIKNAVDKILRNYPPKTKT